MGLPEQNESLCVILDLVKLFLLNEFNFSYFLKIITERVFPSRPKSEKKIPQEMFQY